MMVFQRARCQESGTRARGSEPRRRLGGGTPVALDVPTMLRRATSLLCLLALMGGGAATAHAAEAAGTESDLAAQAAEILSLERLARDTDDVLLRDAARRQIDRLESRARSRAADELGRDFFRERAAGSGLEGGARDFGVRDVRVFGGREISRPPRALGRNTDDGRGRGNDRLGDERGDGRSGQRDGDRGPDGRHEGERDNDRDDDRDDRDDQDDVDNGGDEDRDGPDLEADAEQDAFTEEDQDDEMDRSELEVGDDRE